MFGRKSVIFILITLLALALVLIGCSSTGDNAPANLSGAEKEKLTKQLKAVFIDRYPDEQGIVKIYGELTNNTNRQLISATIAASDVVTKDKNTTYGTVVVSDVKPYGTKSFEIATGRGIKEIGDTVIFTVQDAQFH